MFSRSSQLPIDLTMLTPTEIRTSWPDYVKNWKEQMKKHTVHPYNIQMTTIHKRYSKEQHKKIISNYFRTRWQSVDLELFRAWRSWKSQQLLWKTDAVYINIQWCIRWDLNMIQKEKMTILHRNMKMHCGELFENSIW